MYGSPESWLGNSGRLPRGDWDEWGGLVGAEMGEIVSGRRGFFLAQVASGRAGQGSWQEVSPCWLQRSLFLLVLLLLLPPCLSALPSPNQDFEPCVTLTTHVSVCSAGWSAVMCQQRRSTTSYMTLNTERSGTAMSLKLLTLPA